MTHRVDRKILLDVINPWSKVDRNILVSLWKKIHACVRKIGVPAPLRESNYKPLALCNLGQSLWRLLLNNSKLECTLQSLFDVTQ